MISKIELNRVESLPMSSNRVECMKAYYFSLNLYNEQINDAS